MKLYHATTIGGLENLRAESRDRDGKKILYLTDNFPYSLFYIRDRDINFVSCGVREDGIVHYDEKFPDQLKTLYQGLSGWIYEVDADFERTNINGIYVAHEAVPVTGKILIPDVFQAIQKEINNGTIDLYSYEKATDMDKRFYYDGALYELRSSKAMHPKREEFFRIHFPEAWKEARTCLDKSQCQCYDSQK